MKTGAHIWISGGFEKASETAVYLGCQCIQIFLHNPRSWKVSEKNEQDLIVFVRKLKKKNIKPLVVHMPYLINLSSSDREIFSRSIERLQMEINEAEKMKADFYVIHPGGCYFKPAGLKQLAGVLNQFNGMNIKILVENTSGQGNQLGGTWKELGYLYQKSKNIGFCFDTAHAFAAGNDFTCREGFLKMKQEIEKFFPLDSILLVHANDTNSKCGSKLDRHQHLGKGLIEKAGFINLISDRHFFSLPFIIETPKASLKEDRKNLQWLRKLMREKK